MNRQRVSSGSPFESVFGYCRGVKVGNHVNIAGTCASQDCLDGTTAYEQAVSALDIIQTALAELGTGPETVVRTITYLTNIEDMAEVGRAHSGVFGAHPPVSTCVEVTKLADPRMVVEIEAYAITDG